MTPFSPDTDFLNPERIATYRLFLTRTIPEATKRLIAFKKPAWGKMTAQHMIEHLQTAVVASTIIKRSEPIAPNAGQLQARKVLLYSEERMARNLQNPIFQYGLPPYSNASLDEAKAKLLQSLTRFFEIYDGQPQAYSYNPFLGDLSVPELIAFHYKHIKHHYEQFELV
ncbi:DUF1569 domain-containing protein [Hugenholtzia roseola]|uniref:DUF1569 domain-containing protein n=1 Tax=Hugenholtzia roseola TaxID=1002 RepID=UPI0004112729|nr:DUF1569 domain-containing protein [Hugenholtzia roseola]